MISYEALEPPLAEFWRNYGGTSGGSLYYLGQASQEEGVWYYGHTEDMAMASLGETLRQSCIAFTEVDESQLPEWSRRNLTELRGY